MFDIRYSRPFLNVELRTPNNEYRSNYKPVSIPTTLFSLVPYAEEMLTGPNQEAITKGDRGGNDAVLHVDL